MFFAKLINLEILDFRQVKFKCSGDIQTYSCYGYRYTRTHMDFAPVNAM